ncbi:MAG: PfkB family carbohydrate kinase [Syntrophales bacterium]|nr:PfkB family carbohydrate kinase [Syntrophales bacterium]
MSETGIDVFGLGQCSLDNIGTASTYPGPDSKCEISEMIIQGGGPVATALVALTRWGISCFFSGLAGDDSFGRQIEESMRSEGVVTDGLVIRAGSSSQVAFIIAEPENGRRTIFWRRPTGEAVLPEEVDVETLGISRIFHTDGLFVHAALHGARAAKKKGIPVVVDAGTLRDGMLDLARISDFYIASESFSRALVGGDDPQGACRKILELGPALACVTLGAKGYVAHMEDKIIEKPAYPVKAIDTTGCGDVFHAGFIYGLLKNRDPSRCLDMGAWAAARVSTRLGGRTGIPSLSDLRASGYI